MGQQAMQQRQGGLAWPAVTGQVQPGGGFRQQTEGLQGGLRSAGGGSWKFLFNLKPPVLIGPLFRVEGVVAGTMLVEFLLRHATLD